MGGWLDDLGNTSEVGSINLEVLLVCISSAALEVGLVASIAVISLSVALRVNIQEDSAISTGSTNFDHDTRGLDHLHALKCLIKLSKSRTFFSFGKKNHQPGPKGKPLGMAEALILYLVKSGDSLVGLSSSLYSLPHPVPSRMARRMLSTCFRKHMTMASTKTFYTNLQLVERVDKYGARLASPLVHSLTSQMAVRYDRCRKVSDAHVKLLLLSD